MSSAGAGFTANLDLFPAAAAEVAGIHDQLESTLTTLKTRLDSLGSLPWTDDGEMDETGEKFSASFQPAAANVVAALESVAQTVGGLPQALRNALDSYQGNENSAKRTLGQG